MAAQYSVEFVPSQDGSGEMLFLREGTLLAQPFDLRRPALSVSFTETALMVAPAVVLVGCCMNAMLDAPAAMFVSANEAVPETPETLAVTV